jgi:hypothetical protein
VRQVEWAEPVWLEEHIGVWRLDDAQSWLGRGCVVHIPSREGQPIHFGQNTAGQERFALTVVNAFLPQQA